MSEKIRYLQFALLLSVIGIGCNLLSGCGDDRITLPSPLSRYSPEELGPSRATRRFDARD